MRVLLSSLLLLSSASIVVAQPAPQQAPFVPFTVEQGDYAQLQTFLSEQPFKVASPLLQFLQRKEMDAVAADQAKKSPPSPSPPAVTPQ